MSYIKEFIERYCLVTGQSLDLETQHVQGLAEEAFRIEGNILSFSSLSGLRNGINHCNSTVVKAQGIKQGTSAPSFGIRGVIEGFYGTPWTHDQRIKGLTLFAKKNLNTFILAPKDDPWQRFDWRTPFSDAFLTSTHELNTHSKDLLIELNVCVSPGLTVSYSSQADVDALLVRYRQLLGIGVKRFGLLLDDIPGELQFDSDRDAFSTIAEAHAAFANKVLESLKKVDAEASLFVCPLQYHGRGNEPYISEIGRKLSPEIDLMWTGRQICSEYLDVFDAEKFLAGTTKKPFYWDNFPVNDVAMVHQLHIGPIQKREQKLGSHAVGLVANPMDRFEASLLPLITIADYLWDSESYDADQSWNRALEELVPVEIDRNALRHLFRNCFESCLAVDAAPDFGGVLGGATLAWRTGRSDEAAELFESYSNAVAKNHQIIGTSDFSWPEIQGEITPWLRKYKAVGEALGEVAQILRDTPSINGHLKGTPEKAEKVRKIRISLAQDPTRIFGDGLDLVLGELATELSVV